MHRVTNCCKSDTGKIGILPGLNSFIICATGKERTVFLRILRNKAVLLGAQRRKATLLFCDVGLTVTRCRRQPFVQAYPRVPSVQRKGPWDPAERAGGGHMADAASPSYHPGGCTIHAIFQDNCSHCREPKWADPRLTANARTDDLALADEYEARGVPISAMLEESEARADSARDQALADASPRASVRAAALLARVSSVVSLAQPDPGLAVRDDPECEMSRPAPCEMIPGDEYEVQAVIDHRDGAHGQTEYRVAWVGYPDEEQDTWEPSQNLTEHAGEILTAYILENYQNILSRTIRTYLDQCKADREALLARWRGATAVGRAATQRLAEQVAENQHLKRKGREQASRRWKRAKASFHEGMAAWKRHVAILTTAQERERAAMIRHLERERAVLLRERMRAEMRIRVQFCADNVEAVRAAEHAAAEATAETVSDINARHATALQAVKNDADAARLRLIADHDERLIRLCARAAPGNP